LERISTCKKRIVLEILIAIVVTAIAGPAQLSRKEPMQVQAEISDRDRAWQQTAVSKR
jgi:hypothetical protein